MSPQGQSYPCQRASSIVIEVMKLSVLQATHTVVVVASSSIVVAFFNHNFDNRKAHTLVVKTAKT